MRFHQKGKRILASPEIKLLFDFIIERRTRKPKCVAFVYFNPSGKRSLIILVVNKQDRMYSLT